MLQRIALFGCLVLGAATRRSWCATHRLSQCGNGVVEASEACDDGNTADDDAHRRLSGGSKAGDSIARADLDAEDPGYEYCDDGNTEDADVLEHQVLAYCGDGITRLDLSMKTTQITKLAMTATMKTVTAA